MISKFNCNSVPDFSKIMNTGSNVTALFTKEFYDKVSLEIGFNYTTSSFFAVDDATKEIVGHTSGESEYDDFATTLAVWGIDSTATGDEGYVGVADSSSFSIYMLDSLEVYKIQGDFVFTPNMNFVIDENYGYEFVCTIAQSDDSYKYIYDKLVALEDELDSETTLNNIWFDSYMDLNLKYNKAKKYEGKYNDIYQEWFNAMNEISHVSRQTLADLTAEKTQEILSLTSQVNDLTQEVRQLSAYESGNEVLKTQISEKNAKIGELNLELQDINALYNAVDITSDNQSVYDAAFEEGVTSVDLDVDTGGFYDSGFSEGVASVDITSDNDSIFQSAYQEGVESVDKSSEVAQITKLKEDIKALKSQIESTVITEGTSIDSTESGLLKFNKFIAPALIAGVALLTFMKSK